VVSHDFDTMVSHFRARLAGGDSSPGLLVVPQEAPIGPAAEAIVLIWAAMDAGELRDQVYHLPSLTDTSFRADGISRLW
jgi:hypothetical protein